MRHSKAAFEIRADVVVGADGRFSVALATAAIAAQELYPLRGHGPITQEDLAVIQQLRESDVRTLHRFQLNAQRVLLAPSGEHPIIRWLLPKVLPWLFHAPFLPRVQRRLFVGTPLPPLDPAFSFRTCSQAQLLCHRGHGL